VNDWEAAPRSGAVVFDPVEDPWGDRTEQADRGVAWHREDKAPVDGAMFRREQAPERLGLRRVGLDHQADDSKVWLLTVGCERLVNQGGAVWRDGVVGCGRGISGWRHVMPSDRSQTSTLRSG
jgi:hypothetical protein